MASLPGGSKIALATEFSVKKSVTAISNATEAVCSCDTHGLQAGDIIMLYSGWGRLDNKPFRVKAVTADTFTLEGQHANTTDTKQFSAGGGAGAFTKASTWVDVLKILKMNTSGGDAKKSTFRYLDSENELEINDGFSAVSRQLDVDADALETAGYAALVSLTASGADTIQRVTTRNGAVSYLACTVAMNEEVKMQDGQVNAVSAVFSGKSRSTRYAS